MTRLSRTDFALEQVKAHLEQTDTLSSPIENYLVQFLMVSFYSEMEEQVKFVYSNRLHFNGDERLAHFVKETHDNMMRRVKKSEINDLAKCFGDDCRVAFERELEEADVQAYSSVIVNRHNTSHGRGGTITLPNLEKAILAAEKILDSLHAAIQ